MNEPAINERSAFDEGYRAFQDDEGWLDNPYLESQDTSARLWVDGYVKAMLDSKNPR